MKKLIYLCVLSALSFNAQAETYKEKMAKIDATLADARINTQNYRASAPTKAKLFSPNSLSGDYVSGSTLSVAVESAYCDTGTNYPMLRIRVNINSADQGRAGLVYLGYTNSDHSDGWYMGSNGSATVATNLFAPYVAVLPAGGSLSFDIPVPGYDLLTQKNLAVYKIYAAYGILTDADEANIQTRIKNEQDLDKALKDEKNNKNPKLAEINAQLLAHRANSPKFDPAGARRSAIESNAVNDHKSQYVAVNSDYEKMCYIEKN